MSGASELIAVLALILCVVNLMKLLNFSFISAFLAACSVSPHDALEASDEFVRNRAALVTEDAGVADKPTPVQVPQSSLTVTAEYFAAVREAIKAIPLREFEYSAICRYFDSDRFLLAGQAKFACRLREPSHLLEGNPSIALLFSRHAGTRASVDSERATLENIKEQTRALGHPIITAPVDSETFDVPCFGEIGELQGRTDRSGRHCRAYLQVWFDASRYQQWQTWQQDHTVVPLERAIHLRLSGGGDALAKRRACDDFWNLVQLTDKGFEIDDPQGFLGFDGVNAGRIIIADPLGISRGAPHYAAGIHRAYDRTCGHR